MRSWGGFVWIGNGGLIAHDNFEVRLFLLRRGLPGECRALFSSGGPPFWSSPSVL